MKDASGNETSLKANVTLGVTDSQRTLGTVWKPSSDGITYSAQLTTPTPQDIPLPRRGISCQP